MGSVLHAGRDTAVQLRDTGEQEHLKKLFYERTKEWKYHIMNVEGGTIDVFYDVKDMNCLKSFNLIPTAVSLVLEQEDIDLFTTALSLLYRCIEMSKIAEVPEFLLEKWTLIDERVKNARGCDCDIYWELIRKWYGVR